MYLKLLSCVTAPHSSQMWQSFMEIEDGSVAYFDRITAFEVLLPLNFHWGWGSYMLCRLIKYSHIYEVRTSPTPNGGSSAIRHFKHSDVIKTHDGIIFDFYTGLPQIFCHIFQAHHCVQSAVLWTCVKGGAHTCFGDVWLLSVKHVWAPPL